MKVIFIKDQKIKDVSTGYAVNYLIPQKLAVLATPQNIKRIETQKLQADSAEKKSLAKEEVLIKKLSDKEVIIKTKAGKKGKLFGAITKKDIARKLQINKNYVILAEPIKKIGQYNIELKFPGKSVKIKLEIKDDQGTPNK